MDKMSEEWFRADGHCSLLIVHRSLLIAIAHSFFFPNRGVSWQHRCVTPLYDIPMWNFDCVS